MTSYMFQEKRVTETLTETSCISEQELTLGQLLAYLDGESTASIDAHLQACAHCRERLDEYKAWESGLTQTLYRFECPSRVDLGEYHLNLLGKAEMSQIKEHLPNCTHCTQELAQLDEFLVMTEPAKKPAVSRMRLGDWLREQIEVLTAQVMIPSAAAVPARLLRSLTPGEEHLASILYSAPQKNGRKIIGTLNVTTDAEDPEKRTVDVNISSKDKWQAQVWRTTPELSEPEPIVRSETGLTIGNLNPDQYAFVLTNDTMTIYIEDVQIP